MTTLPGRRPRLARRAPDLFEAAGLELPPAQQPDPVERILDGLNPDQRSAVLHDQGPLLIIAGAGTGKTQVITRRIAYLIATGKALPREILALTFTEKAAQEMEERVDVLVPYGYTDSWISTFHAFGDRVLREGALRLGLTTRARVLSQAEQAIFLREHLFELPLDRYRPLGNPTAHLQALLGLFSRAKDELVAPEEYLALARSLEEQAEADSDNELLRERAHVQRELAQAYAAYQALLAHSGLIDFGDQGFLSYRLFKEDPLLLDEYQRRFRYILVDEFQDTNFAQFALVQLLAGGHRNLAVVGDDDQSIYKFRGAAISNILQFSQAYPEARRIVLSRNYRSPQPILDAAYRLIRHNDPDRLEVTEGVDKRLIAPTLVGLPPQHLHRDTLTTESDTAARLIHEAVEAGRRRYRDFAILVRSNNDADAFLRALNLRAIPHTFSGARGLYQREEVRALISFLKAVADRDDSLALYHLASSDYYEISGSDLNACSAWAHRTRHSLYDAIRNIIEGRAEAELSLEGEERLARLLQDLDDYADLSPRLSTGQLLYRFLDRSGMLRRMSGDQGAQGVERMQNVARFFDSVRHFGELAQLDHAPQFVEHLDLLTDVGEDPALAEVDWELDAVQVMTVHKAKGLEFPVVFMCSLVSQHFPWRHRRDPIELPVELVKEVLPEGDFHMQEERRLFYVGMTRAKEELYLTSADDYGGLRAHKVSRFVLEALDLPAAPGSEARKTSPLEALRQDGAISPDPAVAQPLPVAAGPLTLSHSQVEEYLTCPWKYRYSRVVRVPVQRTFGQVFGHAVHEALRAYLQARARGESLDLAQVVAAYEANWASEGFISAEHEQRRKQQGRELLASFIAGEEASGTRPAAVEREFSFRLDDVRVIGRWDRFDESPDGAVIIDYKTSDVRDRTEANRRARDNRQLKLYALAYEAETGRLPVGGELRFLVSGLRGQTAFDAASLDQTRAEVLKAAHGIRRAKFDAKPSWVVCRNCEFRQICPFTAYQRPRA